MPNKKSGVSTIHLIDDSSKAGQDHSKPGEPDLVPVGYVSRAHGIRGELVLALTTETFSPEKGDDIWLRPRAGGVARPFVVEKTRAHHKMLLLGLAGITSRTEAEPLKAHTVLVDVGRLPPLDNDEVWLKDLPGLRVIVANEGEQREIGVIAGVEVPAGQVLWSIVTPEGKEILFPAVDEFMVELDLEKGEAHIAPPPGLLDLYC